MNGLMHLQSSLTSAMACNAQEGPKYQYMSVSELEDSIIDSENMSSSG